MPNISFTQESLFQQAIDSDIKYFWDNREEKVITGKNDIDLYTVSMTSTNHTKLIVMVNGRTETVLKYQELFYDLFRQGYDIYAFDHRGQGMSGRIAHDPHMGHVEDFQDYIEDMKTVLDIFPQQKYQNKYLIGHSMGGAITTRYLQTYPYHGFDAVSLSSPMFGIHMPPLLRPIAKPVSKVFAAFASKPSYALGQTGYSEMIFDENALTHSKTRFDWSVDLHANNQKIQMGGPTNHWVVQALHGAQRCVDDAANLNIPVLLMQASLDTIVSNRAHDRFLSKLSANKLKSKKVLLQGSFHEPLLEADEVRNQAIGETLNWFREHQQ